MSKLDELGIAHLADRPYTMISGGERQLVLIARALAQEPRYIVLDEPTASLDFGNQGKVMRQIRSLTAKAWGCSSQRTTPIRRCVTQIALPCLAMDGWWLRGRQPMCWTPLLCLICTRAMSSSFSNGTSRPFYRAERSAKLVSVLG
jgi:hypothetical protein